jgi:spore photoproduct lyase
VSKVEKYRPQKILVESSVRNLPLTKTVIKKLEGVDVGYLHSLPTIPSERSHDPWLDGQKTLLLCRNKGRFFEPCPGTKNYLCCSYKILNFAANCHLNCAYCILQAYLNNPFMVLYTNTDDMFKELDEFLNKSPKTILRVGTGEYTDSLILDHLTSFTQLIVPYFASKDNVFLELKTKTNLIENLEGIEHRDKTMLSWSLNAESIIQSEEANTCSLDDRIKAAYQCQKWGYKLGFHFDPLIYYPGWEDGYKRVLEKLFRTIDPASIRWISLGCFRFIPKLKPVIKTRHPESRILYQEFIKGVDGKMRYFKPVRIEMYTKMAEWIKRYAPGIFIYLCMESEEVWRKSLGFAPRSNQDLKKQLDNQCRDLTQNLQ